MGGAMIIAKYAGGPYMRMMILTMERVTPPMAINGYAQSVSINF
jgi:hypothetical protein